MYLSHLDVRYPDESGWSSGFPLSVYFLEGRPPQMRAVSLKRLQQLAVLSPDTFPGLDGYRVFSLYLDVG